MIFFFFFFEHDFGLRVEGLGLWLFVGD